MPPIYVFACKHCGRVVEELRKPSEVENPAFCTCTVSMAGFEVNPVMEKVPAAPAGHFPGASSWRN
jgi:hypothetical protein